jgi:hypothetical protein
MTQVINIIKLVLLITALFGATSCAAKAPLRFIGAVQIPNSAEQDGLLIGGLSSLGYDADKNELFAICDDTGLKGGPRIHHFALQLTADTVSIESSRVTMLNNQQGEKIFPERIVDAEGLVITPDGNYLVSSEGIDVRGYFSLPALLVFNTEGVHQVDWPIASKFLPKGNKMIDYGVRPNDAFESLTLTPDQNILFMANEKALFQDGGIPSLTSESPIRVIQYERNGDSYQAVAEYVYELSGIARINDDPETVGFKSVSDMMALANNRLVVIEKSFFTKPKTKNSVQLYMAEITGQATDVSELDALAGNDYIPLEKTLWIDLDQFEGTEGFPNLDNVEGITFGPTLENGNRTLLLVTDNNFSPRQRNIFYAFEILSL